MTGDGRGRPVRFNSVERTEFLRLVSEGTRISEAADKLGISRRTPTARAARDENFAVLLAAAKAAGSAARQAAPRPLIHGRPATYNHHKCRCTPCTTAASHARSNAPDRKHATIHPLPAPQPPADPTKFPVLADVV